MALCVQAHRGNGGEVQRVRNSKGADQTNKNEHRECDVIDNISYKIALEILRMNVAFIASQIGRTD